MEFRFVFVWLRLRSSKPPVPQPSRMRACPGQEGRFTHTATGDCWWNDRRVAAVKIRQIAILTLKTIGTSRHLAMLGVVLPLFTIAAARLCVLVHAGPCYARHTLSGLAALCRTPRPYAKRSDIPVLIYRYYALHFIPSPQVFDHVSHLRQQMSAASF